ncbi:hypothetical protein V473_15215 [Sphingobium cupriresistens LL01]|uniref:Uncharacterized protein n=1 Tax=Sphingobium cupriresistens LL01 TaxID=1420583 RepID=A0A0J7XSP9_9SPHN|nr:hypothetical protein V473_15215 [Sphingobium cupriresistens LL01]
MFERSLAVLLKPPTREDRVALSPISEVALIAAGKAPLQMPNDMVRFATRGIIIALFTDPLLLDLISQHIEESMCNC